MGKYVGQLNWEFVHFFSHILCSNDCFVHVCVCVDITYVWHIQQWYECVCTCLWARIEHVHIYQVTVFCLKTVVPMLMNFIVHLFLNQNDYSLCVYITWTNRNHVLLMYLIVNSNREWLQ